MNSVVPQKRPVAEIKAAPSPQKAEPSVKVFTMPDRPDRLPRNAGRALNIPKRLYAAATVLMYPRNKERQWTFWWKVIGYGLQKVAKERGFVVVVEEWTD